MLGAALDGSSRTQGAWDVYNGNEKYDVGKGIGEGGLMCCRATVPVPVGDLGQGITCSCSTGEGFVMYSAQNAATRFGTLTADSSNFVCVKYDNGTKSWTVLVDSGTHDDFIPRDTDLLVATIDFDNQIAAEIVSSEPKRIVGGVAMGYVEGDVEYKYGMYGGVNAACKIWLQGNRISASADAINLREYPKQEGNLAAHYTYTSFRPGGEMSKWEDVSGNGNDAIVNISLGRLFEAGHGGTEAIAAVEGSGSGKITFPSGLVPATGALCTVSRYTTVESLGRIIEGFYSSVSAVEWSFGHSNGKAGAVNYGEFGYIVEHVVPNTEWTVVCGQIEAGLSDPYINVNGIVVHLEEDNLLEDSVSELRVNEADDSEWAISEIAIFSGETSPEFIDMMVASYMAHLSFGTETWYSVWSSPGQVYIPQPAGPRVRGYSNSPSTGSYVLTVAGMNFGANGGSMSPRTRIGGTACEGSPWISDTTVRCLTPSGVKGTMKLVVTAGIRAGTLTEAFSFDVPSLSVLEVGNRATTGSASVTVHGSNFGNFSYTQAARVGDTACEATDWTSDTTVICKLSAGVRGTRRVVMTAGVRAGTLTEAFSFDGPSLLYYSASSDMVAVGGSAIDILGSNFGTASYTQRSRVRSTACEATEWLWDYIVTCKHPAGVGGTGRLTLTAGVRVGTLTESFSYEIPHLTALDSQTMPAIAQDTITIFGSNFGAIEQHSQRARIGGSACDSTQWSDDTTIICMVPTGVGQSLPAAMTVGVQVGTLESAFSFDEADIVDVTQNFPAVADTDVTISGVNFGTADYTITVTVGETVCEFTEWVSDSLVVCNVQPGIGGTLTATIDFGQGVGVPAVVTKTYLDIKYDHPVVTAVSLGNSPADTTDTITIFGEHFGADDYFPQARIGGTACVTTIWESDSTITCTVSKGVGGNKPAIATVGVQVGTMESAFFFDPPSLTDVSPNFPASGSNDVTVSGLNFGTEDYTIQATVGDTDCESVLWVSDTSIVCNVAPGVGGTLGLKVHVGQGPLRPNPEEMIVTLLYPNLKYDDPFLDDISALEHVVPTDTSDTTITIAGSHFGTQDYTPSVWIGDSATIYSKWLDDNQIECTPAPGIQVAYSV